LFPVAGRADASNTYVMMWRCGDSLLRHCEEIPPASFLAVRNDGAAKSDWSAVGRRRSRRPTAPLPSKAAVIPSGAPAGCGGRNLLTGAHALDCFGLCPRKDGYDKPGLRQFEIHPQDLSTNY
ncbi:MAG: hypothetical protein LBF19_07365, partial [Prevotellaceae bacterium]|nr:hypothetical protein [Prevotellaceae bacterium]